MSTCALIEFRDGQPSTETEFANSWRGAAYIWDAMYRTYLKDPRIEYDNWLTGCAGGDNRLWKLASRDDLPAWERAVHASTFDYAIIERKDFAQFAVDLRRFCSVYGDRGHLQSWAEIVEKSDADRIGFMATSVCECLWVTWDEQGEESIEYDFATGTKHFSVYDDIRAEAAA